MIQFNRLSAIIAWLVATTGGCLALLHWNTKNNNITHNNPQQIPYGLVISLLFFNNLNILIAFCEIALGKHIALIQQDYQKNLLEYGGKQRKELQAVAKFMLQSYPITRLLDGKVWSHMWSTYALYDPSYQDCTSFGFFIDVGNGWTTVAPCLLINAAICLPQYCSPMLVGCVGLASYWQIQYGTIIYFLSFFYNQRYQGKPLGQVLAFVGISNGIWFIFPSFGLYACASILNSKDFGVFGCGSGVMTS